MKQEKPKSSEEPSILKKPQMIHYIEPHSFSAKQPTLASMGQSSKKLTRGQALADLVTKFGGSWTFISLFAVFLIVWIIINVWITRTYSDMIVHDPFPFILLNLMLSCLAALQAPIILMSQNREAERDRARAILDYVINRRAEWEVENMQQDLDEIKILIKNLCVDRGLPTRIKLIKRKLKKKAKK